jgi:hypothetical protein
LRRRRRNGNRAAIAAGLSGHYTGTNRAFVYPDREIPVIDASNDCVRVLVGPRQIHGAALVTGLQRIGLNYDPCVIRCGGVMTNRRPLVLSVLHVVFVDLLIAVNGAP